MQMLTATLDEMKSADAEIESMQKAWANGDTGAMSKLFDKSHQRRAVFASGAHHRSQQTLGRTKSPN